MKSIFEQMGGTYRREGDYLIPNLSLPESETCEIGKYGSMHRCFLKEHQPAIYISLLMEGKLCQHLAEIDKACNERMENICAAMEKQEGVTENLKADDQME